MRQMEINTAKPNNESLLEVSETLLYELDVKNRKKNGQKDINQAISMR